LTNSNSFSPVGRTNFNLSG